MRKLLHFFWIMNWGRLTCSSKYFTCYVTKLREFNAWHVSAFLNPILLFGFIFCENNLFAFSCSSTLNHMRPPKTQSFSLSCALIIWDHIDMHESVTTFLGEAAVTAKQQQSQASWLICHFQVWASCDIILNVSSSQTTFTLQLNVDQIFLSHCVIHCFSSAKTTI